MKRTKLIYLAAAVMAFSTPQLTRGEDPKPSDRPNREELREKLKNLTPAERAAKMKEFRESNPQAGPAIEKRTEEMKKMFKDLGLDQQDLKNLSPEERRAKIKEAAGKKMAELEKKKAAGTLTDADKETLQRLEQRKKAMEGRPREGAPGRPRRPGAKKSVD